LSIASTASIKFLYICSRTHLLLKVIRSNFAGDTHALVTEPGNVIAELFEATGAGGSAALLNTVIIGVVNVASTVVAVLVVDN
jgi:hypothetical protein